MADGIRGKNYLNYPLEIQKGLILHRAIDTFTDAHPLFRSSSKRLHSRYHHYAGVIVDVFYDHFLAKNWNRFSDENLEDYIYHFYQSLDKNWDNITEKTRRMMPFMISQNWLLSYQTIEGIGLILKHMDSRTAHKSQMRYATEELQLYYSEFEEEFFEFFEELRTFCKQQLSGI